jgi:hypothetical protein
VLWSDEAYVVLGDNKGPVFITRRSDKFYDDSCVMLKLKQSNLRVMIWGCIMRGRNLKGTLVVLDYPGGRGGMTADSY